MRVAFYLRPNQIDPVEYQLGKIGLESVQGDRTIAIDAEKVRVLVGPRSGGDVNVRVVRLHGPSRDIPVEFLALGVWLDPS